MQKSKIFTGNSSRPLITLTPLPDIKYFCIKNTQIYVDIEQLEKLTIDKTVKIFNKQLKKFLKI